MATRRRRNPMACHRQKWGQSPFILSHRRAAALDKYGKSSKLLILEDGVRGLRTPVPQAELTREVLECLESVIPGGPGGTST